MKSSTATGSPVAVALNRPYPPILTSIEDARHVVYKINVIANQDLTRLSHIVPSPALLVQS